MSIQSVRLEDVADVSWGNTSITKASYTNTGFPAFSATGCDGYLPDFEHVGDGIVLSAIGAQCGKCFMASGKWTAIKNTITITPHKTTKANFRYLYYYLNRDDVWPKRGVAQPFIGLSDARKISLPFPKIEEQQRIAEILDKADALRAKRRAALAQFDTLTQSIFLDMFGDPATNPKGWPTAVFGDHTSKIGSGATPRGGEEAYKKTGITLIRSMNVRDGLFSRDGLAFIDEEQASQLDGVIVEADDVLLNITGASVARVCRAPAGILPARVNQHVAIIRPTDTFNSAFIEKCLLSPTMKRHLLKIAKAGATREAITKGQIEQIRLICPPRPLQDRFASALSAIEVQLRHQQQFSGDLDALFASLQHRAFRGQLRCGNRELEG